MNNRIQKPRGGFTLLEVVLSLAVFLVIAAPVVGLLALTARNSDQQANAVNAEELKRIISNELIAAIDDTTLAWTFDASTVALYASENLEEIAFSSDGTFQDQFKYFSIDVQDPVDVVSSVDDIYRIVLLDIRWPAFVESGGSWVNNLSNETSLEQIIVPLVIDRP